MVAIFAVNEPLAYKLVAVNGPATLREEATEAVPPITALLPVVILSAVTPPDVDNVDPIIPFVTDMLPPLIAFVVAMESAVKDPVIRREAAPTAPEN